MKGDFIKNAKSDMRDYVIKAINDQLAILDSKIEPPRNVQGEIMENKLISCVTARESIYNDVCHLMDLIGITNSRDQNYKNKIIKGLKTTWEELTKITVWDIGNYEFGQKSNEEDDDTSISESDKKQFALENVADNIRASVSSAKRQAAQLCYKILDRIELLENPEKAKEEILNKKNVASIIERYAEN